MLKHIVCFKLANPTDAEKLRAREILLSMIGNVPTLRAIEVGCDFLGSPRSYDVILQVTLDDKAALEEYQNDPYHCLVVKTHMHAAAAASIAVDYYL
ncbi:MAG: Dabb family protein [Eubacteriales bacterium]